MNIVEAIKGPSDADYWARCYVQGTRRHSKTGNIVPVCKGWHDRFLPHPTVRQSVIESWDDELRGHVVGTLKRWLLARAGAKDGGAQWPTPDQLMPDEKWIKGVAMYAARYRQAEQAREAQPIETSVKSFVRLPSVVSADFRKFQQDASRTADGKARHAEPLVRRR